MDARTWIIEGIGWFSTLLFLISILMPQRRQLHSLGMLTAVTTAVYAYDHGATAIWVKWVIAFFFHLVMWLRTSSNPSTESRVTTS